MYLLQPRVAKGLRPKCYLGKVPKAPRQPDGISTSTRGASSMHNHKESTVEISDTGLSVLYEPDAEPIADVVFVHGLQGHPKNTWTKRLSGNSACIEQKSPLRSRFWKRGRQLSERDAGPATATPRQKDIFWPKDLLPSDRSDVRILSWGYDTVVTKGWQQVNKNSLFAHARDFLYALERQRPSRRHIIFVAHSLGGIMVKEMLRRSETSREQSIQDIIRSTAAVVFLGTPHRGSPGLASLGEIVRRTASTILRVDSNATILRALGCDSPELELCRESFTTQWREYDFRVKTFQEAFGIGCVAIGPYAEKVVPDTSSLLDDTREHAETISANHMEMARFSGPTDSGYQKVSGELRIVVDLLYKMQSSQRPPAPIGTHPVSQSFTSLEKECLQYLSFAELGARQVNIRIEHEGTCNWIFDHPAYIEWDQRQAVTHHAGLLWIKGKPGAGKSVIMKKMLSSIESRELPDSIVAAFFFNARGAELERSTMGMYRSLLHQLLQQDAVMRQHFASIYSNKEQTRLVPKFEEAELRERLRFYLSRPHHRRVYLFIDALDECIETEVRNVVCYLRDVTDVALSCGNHLSVCMSSRRYPTITVSRCPEISVEYGNQDDVSRYIYQKILSHADGTVPRSLADMIDTKASDSFLWASLVVEMLLRGWDDGTPVHKLESMVQQIPIEIDRMFDSLFYTMSDEERSETVSLFQWVLLGRDKLSLGSLRYALGFAGNNPPLSFGDFHAKHGSIDITHFTRHLTHLSRGLVEVVVRPDTPKSRLERRLKNSCGRIRDRPRVEVQVIHESVRDWFLYGDGFSRLNACLSPDPIAIGHIDILQVCRNVLVTDDYPETYPRSINWSTECVAHAQGPSLVDKDGVYGITDYSMSQIFAHALVAEVRGMVPRLFLYNLCLPQSRLFDRLRGNIPAWSISHSILPLILRRLSSASVSWVLEHGVDPKCREIDPSVVISCMQFDYPLLKILDQQKPLRSITDQYGGTAVHWAFMFTMCSRERYRVLLDLGFSINQQDSNGMTPVMVAIGMDTLSKGQLAMLVELGADLDVFDNQGRTALHIAVGLQYWERLEALLKHGASPTSRNKEGKTPLHQMAALGISERIKRILSFYKKLDIQDLTGSTPLHLATLSADEDSVELLILAGADVNCMDETGQTPLHIAARKMSYKTLRSMLLRGGDQNIKDRFGMTAANYAEAYSREQDIIDLLEHSIAELE